MEPTNLHDGDYHRIATFGGPQAPGTVQVLQTVDLKTLAWASSTVTWSSVGTQTPTIARQFAERIQAAADLADKWDDERRGQSAEGGEGGLQRGAE